MNRVRDWLNERAISPEIALSAGVRYDPKRNALMFPRVGMNHMPLGWKLRGLATKTFITIPSGISNADCEPFTAREGTKELCICEGELDALALASWVNFIPDLEDPHIVGLPGANTFQNEYAGMYSRFDTIYLFPDPDTGGERLTEKVCGLMARTLVVDLDPKVGDLNDNIKENFGGVLDAISNAKPRPSTTRLRRTNYEFQRTHDIPDHVLLDEALRTTELKRVGKEYRGKCPLHDGDTDPSFMIDPKKGVFYCHGCKKGGDIITFIQERDGLSYGQAKSRALSLR